MAIFYVTFPQRLEGLKDKYAEVHAPTEEKARELAFERYGQGWAFIYPEKDFGDAIERFDLQLHEQLP